MTATADRDINLWDEQDSDALFAGRRSLAALAVLLGELA